MSHHRDLVEAQAALNEAVREWVRWEETPMNRAWSQSVERRYATDHVVSTYKELETIQNDLDATTAPAVARDTSIAASYSNMPRKGSMRRDVIQTLVAYHSQFDAGMTCDDLERRLRKSHQSMSPRVHELEKGGWIVDSKERKLTRSGQKAIVWRPTDKAIDRMREAGLNGKEVS